MQVLTIPDLHGRDCWKTAVNSPDLNKADKIIFLGDYVDSYDLSNEIIYDNLCEIIRYKKQEGDKVELLLGNHDIHYLFYPLYRCSGFRSAMQHDLSLLYNENKSLFKVAIQFNNYLWTHAGVSNGWLQKNYSTLLEHGLSVNNYAEVFNNILGSHDNDVLHQVSHIRRGGDLFGGITWADRQETIFSPLKDMNQYVGHTPVPRPSRHDVKAYNASITYLDCLQKVEEFYLFAVV